MRLREQRHFGLGIFGRRARISYLQRVFLLLFIKLAVLLFLLVPIEDCIHHVMGGMVLLQ